MSLAAGAGKDVLLLLLLGSALWLGRDRLVTAPRSIWIVLVCFLALLFLQALLAPVSIRASLLSARFHATFLLLAPIAVAVFGSMSLHRQLTKVLFVTAVVLAVAWLSVIGWAGLSDLGFQAATIRVIAEQGEMGDPINVFGTYFAVMLCLAVGVGGLSPNRKVRLTLYAAAVLLAWALLATFSRRAIVGAAVGVLVIAIAGRRMRLLIPMLAGGAIVIAYASRSLIERFTRVNFRGGATTRLEHLRYTIENLDPLSVFIGHGVGTAGHVALAAGVQGAVPIHNYYALLVFETGLFGLLLYLGLCYLCLRSMLEVQADAGNPWLVRGFAAGTIGALVCFLLAGLLGIGNAVLPGAPIIWTSVGAVLAWLPSTRST